MTAAGETTSPDTTSPDTASPPDRSRSRVGGDAPSGGRAVRRFVFGPRGAALAIWLSIAGALWWWAGMREVTPIDLMAPAVEWLRDRPAAAAVLYVLAYAARPLVFFSAALLTVAGGYLFGPVIGILLTIVAANLSAAVAYGIGRALGPAALGRGDDLGLLSRWAGRMRANAFETVLIMRFLLLPYDAVSYLAGFLRMRFRAFIAATALGSLTGTAQFVLLGAALEDFTPSRPTLDTRALVASLVFMAIGLALSRAVKRRERDRDGREGGIGASDRDGGLGALERDGGLDDVA